MQALRRLRGTARLDIKPAYIEKPYRGGVSSVVIGACVCAPYTSIIIDAHISLSFTFDSNLYLAGEFY